MLQRNKHLGLSELVPKYVQQISAEDFEGGKWLPTTVIPEMQDLIVPSPDNSFPSPKSPHYKDSHLIHDSETPRKVRQRTMNWRSTGEVAP